MKKVFQTIVDKGKGNCLQACTASLFELKLEEVPAFIENGQSWYLILEQFYQERGYTMNYFSITGLNLVEVRKALRADGGVNGYFDATVESQTFEGCTHSVVCDLDLNIIHDPNPNARALQLGPSDILNVVICNADANWYINEHGKFKENLK